MVTPVTADVSLCREAARASALAAHSAAGLCASAQLRTAARLLRSAEALSRAAVAALGAAHVASTSSTSETAALPPSALPARARRRRKHKKAGKNVADCMVDDTGTEEILGMVSGCAASPPVPLEAVVAEPARPKRVLAAKTSRERSPRRSVDEFRSSSPSLHSGSAVESTGEVFTKDMVVVLSGLASRSELNGVRAKVLSHDDASGRYAVRLPTGEDIRVRAANMKRSMFGFSFAAT